MQSPRGWKELDVLEEQEDSRAVLGAVRADETGQRGGRATGSSSDSI